MRWVGKMAAEDSGSWVVRFGRPTVPVDTSMIFGNSERDGHNDRHPDKRRISPPMAILLACRVIWSENAPSELELGHDVLALQIVNKETTCLRNFRYSSVLP